MWVSKVELTRVLGETTAQALLEHCGGKRIIVPQKPMPKHRLVKYIGVIGMMKLCAEYKNIRISLPVKSKKTNKEAIVELLAQGKSNSEIATLVGCSMRWAEKVRQDTRDN